MPLVANTNVDPNDPKEQWTNKLVGKTIHDDESTATAFSKKELPEKSRVLKPGTITTRDFRADRLNVHCDDEGIVTHVTFG